MRGILIGPPVGARTCDRIIALAEQSKFSPARIYLGNTGVFAVDDDHRKTQEVSFCDRSQFEWLIEVVRPAANEAADMFGFDKDKLWVPQGVRIIKYLPGNFHHWHTDTAKDSRRLTVIIQLSDDTDYTGANLQFKSEALNNRVPRDKGSVIVFPSSLEHCVTECISGARYSAVMWFEIGGTVLPAGFLYA